MKNGVSIFKSLVPAIIVAIFFLWFKGCNCTGAGKATRDTISVKVETIREVIKHDTSYVPKERKVYIPHAVHDTLESFEIALVDTARILSDWNATRYYADTLPNKYGQIIIADTVTRNRIKGRGVQTNLGMITTIKTYTVEAKKRNVVLVGLEVLGNTSYPLYATGVSLNLKNKQDKIYGVKAMLLKDGSPVYGIQLLMPIRLTKK